MNIDEILEAVEQVLLSRRLSPIERLVLRQSCLGQDYSEIARHSAYSISRLKEVGSELWHELSEALGEKVTKKNLLLPVKQYLQKQTGRQFLEEQRSLPADTGLEGYLKPPVKDEMEFPSDSVPLGSPLYINRPPVEELAYSEISQPRCLIRIKSPRHTGKSSLLNRILAHAATIGYKRVYLDFQEADREVFDSLDKLLRWFAANVTRQLNLTPKLDDYWDEDMGSKVSCKIYFEGYLLKEINTPIVLALNEVNRVFEYPKVAQDFLMMLRFWHEQGKQIERWEKLRLVLVYSTEIYIPLKLNQSPFNIGLPIGLPNFNLEQVQDLAGRYGLNWKDSIGRRYAESLQAMVGGHPYLVNVALYHLSRRKMTFEQLLQTAATPSGIYSHHLRSLLAILENEPELVSDLQQVVTANESVWLEAIAAYKLESMGLVQLDGNLAKPSCELYRLYFREQLVKKDHLMVNGYRRYG